MIESLISKVTAVIASAVMFFTGIFAPTPIVDEDLGVSLPSATAVFETSLSSGITDTATTMTLTSNSVRGGGSLSGYECFTIDEGSAQAEYVCGDVATTTVSNLERGLSPADGITQDSDLMFSHRRGASVKITDFPLLQRLRSQSNGGGTYESTLKYSTSVGTTSVASDGQNLASVAYVNSLSFGGVSASASTSVAGFVELATGEESASTTIFGSTGAMLALHTGIATSVSPTSGNVVVVTGDDGNIDSGFLQYVTVGSSTIRTYTTGSSSAYTYTKPTSSLFKFSVFELIGAGGGGAGSPGASETTGQSGGGGAGAYCRFILDKNQLSTTTLFMVGLKGGGGSSGASGANGSSTVLIGFATSTGGFGGSTSAGGAGGTTQGICSLGVGGNPGSKYYGSIGGNGGSSYLGGAGLGSRDATGGSGATGSGGGGAGDSTSGGTSFSGGDGGEGVVIITEYY